MENKRETALFLADWMHRINEKTGKGFDETVRTLFAIMLPASYR
ncbi:hypothetical protein DB29_01262 [Shouchella clausii]|nr:hypothetical protein DB29_01262 [Shouchella clausii]